MGGGSWSCTAAVEQQVSTKVLKNKYCKDNSNDPNEVHALSSSSKVYQCGLADWLNIFLKESSLSLCHTLKSNELLFTDFLVQRKIITVYLSNCFYFNTGLGLRCLSPLKSCLFFRICVRIRIIYTASSVLHRESKHSGSWCLGPISGAQQANWENTGFHLYGILSLDLYLMNCREEFWSLVLL